MISSRRTLMRHDKHCSIPGTTSPAHLKVYRRGSLPAIALEEAVTRYLMGAGALALLAANPAFAVGPNCGGQLARIKAQLSSPPKPSNSRKPSACATPARTWKRRVWRDRSARDGREFGRTEKYRPYRPKQVGISAAAVARSAELVAEPSPERGRVPRSACFHSDQNAPQGA